MTRRTIVKVGPLAFRMRRLGRDAASPAVGKTHLAIARGREAMREGYSVLFTAVPALIANLAKTHAEAWRSAWPSSQARC